MTLLCTRPTAASSSPIRVMAATGGTRAAFANWSFRPASITSIPDPDGAIHRLVELADGSRSTPELVSDLQSDYPQIGEQDVVDAVFQLESVGLFVDCAPRHRILGDRDTRLMHLVL